MQLFAPHKAISDSVKTLDDARLGKQIIECAQIMSTVMHIHCAGYAPYKPTHQRHPLVLWAGECVENFDYVLEMYTNSAHEWYYRRGRMHGASVHRDAFVRFAGTMPTSGSQAKPINATTNHKHIADVHAAYRACLREKWQHDKRAPRWTRRARPAF